MTHLSGMPCIAINAIEGVGCHFILKRSVAYGPSALCGEDSGSWLQNRLFNVTSEWNEWPTGSSWWQELSAMESNLSETTWPGAHSVAPAGAYSTTSLNLLYFLSCMGLRWKPFLLPLLVSANDNMRGLQKAHVKCILWKMCMLFKIPLHWNELIFQLHFPWTFWLPPHASFDSEFWYSPDSGLQRSREMSSGAQQVDDLCIAPGQQRAGMWDCICNSETEI